MSGGECRLALRKKWRGGATLRAVPVSQYPFGRGPARRAWLPGPRGLCRIRGALCQCFGREGVEQMQQRSPRFLVLVCRLRHSVLPSRARPFPEQVAPE